MTVPLSPEATRLLRNRRAVGDAGPYILYNGELVSQDALGNINYGYFGTHCNIPNAVLLLGGGVAQIMADTSKPQYWTTFFDDPRDSYRVQQGIDLYRQMH